MGSRKNVALRYVGAYNSTGEPSFLDGVPARDLTEHDVETRSLDIAELLASGLYEEVGSKAKSKKGGN